MNLLNLCNLQTSLFIMMLVGYYCRKKEIISDEGRRCLTDLCINVIIPCNIVKSCLKQIDGDILVACAGMLAVATIMQVLCLVLNKFLFNRFGEQQRKVLQYCTIVSNGGFLGNPVCEGIYGATGLLFASIVLIPMRIVMWSAATSYFVAGSMDKKKVLKNVLTHPCLVAVYLGMIIMFTGLPLPDFIKSTVTYIGNANSCITMFIVGTVLTQVKLSEIVNRTTVIFSVFRLIILPAITFGLCLVFSLSGAARGVPVAMVGMPAGSTAAIFAARYGSDAPFAAKLVVLSTLLSMVTIPLWCYFVG